MIKAPLEALLCTSRKSIFLAIQLGDKFHLAVAPARGGKGGRLPPNVEKDGSRNSSKFDEIIGGGGGYPSQM